MTIPIADENEEQEVSFIAGGNSKWHSSFGKRFQLLTNLNRALPYNPAITLVNIYSNSLKTYVHRENLHVNVSCSFIRNCQTLERNQDAFQWVNAETKCGAFIQSDNTQQ